MLLDTTLQLDGKPLILGMTAELNGWGLIRLRGDEAIEFQNVLTGHYFVTANPAEQASIGAGASGPGWTTTGESFRSYASTPACRFAGTPGLGPNTHFFTIDSEECEHVKQDAGWRFEGFDFSASPLVAGGCGRGEQRVYRAYNGQFDRNDSNHRYATNPEIYQSMIDAGWLGEGPVFCVPR